MRTIRQTVAYSSISSKMANASMPHPFNYDYAYLNELKRYDSQKAAMRADHSTSTSQLKRNAQNRRMYFIECWFRHLYEKSDATKQAQLKKEWLGYYVQQQKESCDIDRLESISKIAKVPVKEIAIAEQEIVALADELKTLETAEFLDAEHKSEDLKSKISTLSTKLKRVDAQILSLNNLIEELVKKSNTDNGIQAEIFDASEELDDLEKQDATMKADLEELTTQLEAQKTILNNFPLEKITTLREALSHLDREQHIRKFHGKTIEDINSKLTELDQLSLNTSGIFTDAAVESKFNESMKKTPTTWQAFAASTFEKSASDDKSADAFMTFILESASSYLPERYMPYNEVTANAEFKFPGSADQRVPYNEFAHILTHTSGGKLIASHVPMVTPHETEKNNTATQNFLGMLHEMNVSMVIDLGTDDDRRKRAAYHDVKNGQYTTLLVPMQAEYSDNSDDSDIASDSDDFSGIAANATDCRTQQYSVHRTLNLQNTATQKNNTIALSQIFVPDNETLDLDTMTLKTILTAHHKYQHNETVLVHCSSGVGRTGQARLLIALLDAFSDDVSFKNACLSIITISLSETKNAASALLLDNSLDCFFDKMSGLLRNLRKTRHCVQTEAQFNGTFPQFMLLAGKMIGLSDNELNLLRKRLSMSQSAVNDVVANPVAPRLPASTQSPSPNPRANFFGSNLPRALAASASSADTQEQIPNARKSPIGN